MNRPAFTQPAGNRFRRNVDDGCPFSDTERLPTPRYQMITAPVTVLLVRCAPTYITRLVMTIYVFAVEGVCRAWSSSHFGKKFREGCKPKFDTTTAILCIIVSTLIRATSLCSVVSGIFTRACATFGFAMDSIDCQPGDASLTAARLRMSRLQISRCDRGPLTAGATAQPNSDTTVPLTVDAKYPQVSKVSAHQVMESVASRGKGFEGRAKVQIRHFDLLNRLKCSGLRESFTRFSKPLLLYPVFTCILFVFGVSAQCVATSTDPCISVHQSLIDKAANAATELLAARDALAQFAKERGASEAERAASQKLIEGLNNLIATKDRIQTAQNEIIALYKSVVEMQQGIIERYEKQLSKGKSAWQKFAATLEKVAYLLAGVALAGAL